MTLSEKDRLKNYFREEQQMKNIEELLGSLGIEIPEEKKEEFDKNFNENYKTIAEVTKLKEKLETSKGDYDNLNKTLSQRDADLEELKQKLKESGADTSKIEELQSKLDQLQADYNKQGEDFKKEISKRDYKSKIEDASKDLKFTSTSAKESFMAKAIEKNFTIEGDKVLGFQDFVNEYKEKDSGAFAEKTDVKMGGKSQHLEEPKKENEPKRIF